MKNSVRKIAKKIFYSPNGLRHRLEGRCLKEAFQEEIKHQNTLVDAGAGGGEYCLRLFAEEYVDNIVAVEPFEKNFNRLKANLTDYIDQQRAKVLQETIDNISLEDASVDVVTCNQVLEHIEDHESVVKEFYRIVKPGGWILASVPRSPVALPQEGHVRDGYTEKEFNDLFESAGFSTVRNDWFYIDTTQKYREWIRFWTVERKIPIPKFLLPLEEASLSRAEKFKRSPMGLVGLYQKPAE